MGSFHERLRLILQGALQAAFAAIGQNAAPYAFSHEHGMAGLSFISGAHHRRGNSRHLGQQRGIKQRDIRRCQKSTGAIRRQRF